MLFRLRFCDSSLLGVLRKTSTTWAPIADTNFRYFIFLLISHISCISNGLLLRLSKRNLRKFRQNINCTRWLNHKLWDFRNWVMISFWDEAQDRVFFVTFFCGKKSKSKENTKILDQVRDDINQNYPLKREFVDFILRHNIRFLTGFVHDEINRVRNLVKNDLFPVGCKPISFIKDHNPRVVWIKNIKEV